MASPLAAPVRSPSGDVHRRRLPVRVFLLAFLVFAYFMPRWADWNIDSRFDLTRAIVDQHTLRIDRYHWNTWDKAVYRGRYYSDKAPGTAVLGAVVYAGFAAARGAPLLGGAIRGLERNGAWTVAINLGRTDTQGAPAAKGRVLGGCQRTGVQGNVQYIPWGNRLYPPFTDWALSKYVVTVGTVALLSALFVAFFFWFLGAFTLSRLARWLLTALYAFATVALPYSTVFYSHQLAAAFLFVAFALLFLRQRGRQGRWLAPAAGFLLGLALFTEYTVALIIACVGLYGLWALRRRRSETLAFLLAGAVPVVALLVYNALCFGSPLDSGYSHDFCWSAAQAAGYQGFTYPHTGPLYDLTVGSFRGIFYTSPFLLLSLPGAFLMWRRGFRLEIAVCLVVSVTFVLAISAYWGWNGGQVDGPRYLVPMVPFLALPAVFLLDFLPRRPLSWLLVAPLAGWSLFAAWTQFLGGLLFPTSWLRDPIGQYSLPALGRNEIAPNAGYFLGLRGWQSLLPLLLILAAVVVLPSIPPLLKFLLKRRSRSTASSPFDPGLATE